MAGKHTIQVSVLADTKKFSSALKEVGNASGLSKIGGIAKKAGLAMLAVGSAAGVAAGAIVANGVRGASDLEQSIGAVDAVFKSSADQIHNWAKSAANDLGLTRNEYSELATLMGTQLKNGGTALDELGGKTNDLMVLGSDMAAMFGGSTADAVGALSSALKGERDPIEKYGVSLKQATIDAKAAELGFTKVGGSLTDEAQQAATLALIMEQTADAHGTFAKESDTLAGKQQRLQATLGNLSTRIGMIFLPLISTIASFIGDRVMPVMESWAGVLERNLGPALERLGTWVQTTVVPGLQRVATWVQAHVVPALIAMGAYLTGTLWPALLAFGQWLIDAQGWLLPLAVAIGAMVITWKLWTTAVATWTAITKLAAAGQALMNVVLKANPIGIVITAIAGLVAALVWLYNNNETVRKAIDKAWAWIKSAIDKVASWISGTAIPWIVNAWTRLSGGATDMWNKVRSTFNSLKGGASDLWNKIKSAVDKIVTGFGDLATKTGQKIGDVVAWFAGLPGRIINEIKGIPARMSSMGGDIVQGLINGVKNMGGRLRGALRGIVDDAVGSVKNFLGIASPSRVFRVIGEQTGDGLRLGLDATRTAIARQAARLAHTVETYGTPSALNLTATGTGAGAGAPTTIQIVLPGVVTPSVEAGRMIADALRPYLRSGGKL